MLDRKIWLKVRHAQGIHNVVLEEKRGIDEIGDVHLSPKLFDAPLSPKGVQQVRMRYITNFIRALYLEMHSCM